MALRMAQTNAATLIVQHARPGLAGRMPVTAPKSQFGVRAPGNGASRQRLSTFQAAAGCVTPIGSHNASPMRAFGGQSRGATSSGHGTPVTRGATPLHGR